MARTATETIKGTPGVIINDGAGNIGIAPAVVLIDPLTGLPTSGGGAPPVVSTLQSAVITTATGTGVAVNGSGPRWYQTLLTGTGAITATVYIDVSADNVSWVLARWTFTLSGTTSVVEGFSSAEKAPYVRSRIGAITGTGAASTTTVSA